MELFTIFLCGLLGLVSPVGVVIDRTAEHTIRAQFAKVGKLKLQEGKGKPLLIRVESFFEYSYWEIYSVS